MTILPPRYRQIAEALLAQMRTGELAAGQTLPTEPELAQQFGVTRVTLRKALDILVADGVVARQQGRGTFVTGVTRDVRPPFLLYVGQLEEHFYQNLYCALTREAQAAGLAVMGYHPGVLESAEVSMYRQRSVSSAKAVIYQISDPHYWRIISPEIPPATPILTFSTGQLAGIDATARQPAYHLCLDMHAALYLATTHLLAFGHRRIALVIAGADDNAHSFPAMVAYQGYQDALRHRGITEEMVIGIPGPMDDWEAQHDRTLRQTLTSGAPLPTAFVCDADFRAVRVLAVLRELGLRCPEDCSVVGVWNTPWCHMTSPPLTSVNLAEDELARLMVLLSRQSVSASPTELIVTPRLVERKSTGAVGDNERRPV